MWPWICRAFGVFPSPLWGGVRGGVVAISLSMSSTTHRYSSARRFAIVTAHDGCLHLEVTVSSKQAHAAMPETGVEMAIALPRADYQRE